MKKSENTFLDMSVLLEIQKSLSQALVLGNLLVYMNLGRQFDRIVPNDR